MKTRERNILGGLSIALAVAGVTAFSFAEPERAYLDPAEETALRKEAAAEVNPLTAKYEEDRRLKDQFRFSEANDDVETAIEAIYFSKAAIHENKEDLKQCRKADDEAGIAAEKQELKRAKADLKRDKGYYKADMKYLKEQRKQEVKDARAQVWQDKLALCEAKKQARKELRKDEPSALVNEAYEVVAAQAALERSEQELANLKGSYEANLAAIDQAWEEEHAEYVAFKNGEEPDTEDNSAMASK